MSAPIHLSKHPTWLLATVGLIGAVTLSGQTTSGNSTSVDSDADLVELSPFTVQASEDVGYQAGNTTSGSRMNTSLRDTAAPISAFTPEFLSDIGATGLEDMMAYATNSEPEFEDATNGFNGAGGRLAGGNDARFRIRGLVAGSSVDYVTSSIPIDLYNIERAEVSSGPNSVLFGLGDAGGNVALTTKPANAGRSRYSLSTAFGSWDYQRTTFDGNIVIKPRKIGLRLMGLYESTASWRKWVFSEQRRMSGSLFLRPLKNTTVRMSFEQGEVDSSAVVNWNPQDMLTAWLDAGELQGDGAPVAGTTRYNNNERYTFVENDGVVYNYRRELHSANRYGSQTLVSPETAPYDVNPVGPGGLRHQEFDSQSIVVEQRIGKTTLELGYYHNENFISANSTDGQPILYGDPNITIPLADYTTQVANPRAGGLYLERRWGHDRVWDENDIIRLSAAREFDLGKLFGRHRVAAMVEHAERERTRYYKTQVLLDENNVAIKAAGNPEGPQNAVYRRNYVTLGDFSTYYMGNGLIPVPDTVVDGVTYHAQEVSRTAANDHTNQSINSYMLAAQSFWWRNRFITTLGYRLDDLGFSTEIERRISDPNDPRIIDGSHALNEWEFTGEYEKHDYLPYTFTAGAVLHATKRFSLFVNTSSNRSSPRFERTVLPDGEIAPPVEGESIDFGFMLDLFGDGRAFMRVTHFDTAQIGDAPIVPNAITTETSDFLGGDNLLNIYQALLDGGAISQERYDAEVVTYKAGMADVYSKGVELELIANPTPNIALRVGYSHSERDRKNVFNEIFDYYAVKGPEWQALAAGDATLLDTVNTELDTIYTELDSQLDRQTGPLGSRPDKFNITGRYQFLDGGLKGLTVGGGVRYQSAQYMSYDRATDTTEKGTERTFGDAFITYRHKSPWWKGSMVFQINVRNITNDHLVEIGRRNDTRDGIRRVYLAQPRSVRFTATFNF